MQTAPGENTGGFLRKKTDLWLCRGFFAVRVKPKRRPENVFVQDLFLIGIKKYVMPEGFCPASPFYCFCLSIYLAKVKAGDPRQKPSGMTECGKPCSITF